MLFPTSTTTKPAQPCKRGHAAGRYANGTCRECQRAAQRTSVADKECKRAYYVNNPKQIMLNGARERAKAGGYPCTITVNDIVIPEFCPLLGLKLKRNLGGQVRPSSPSLDKIRPGLGYVPGNVWVVSHRANAIKRDATLSELETIAKNLAKTYVSFPWEEL